MIFRESGMPDLDYWESLFDVSLILDRFGFGSGTGDVAELGCGYGTFTIPLAQRIAGHVFAIDLDPVMVETTQRRVIKAGLRNVHLSTRDVVPDGFGVVPGSCDAALLFNILHCEDPFVVLSAAAEAVRPTGIVAVIHWRTDIATPRGPSAAIRPRPEQILEWADRVGGLELAEPPFMLTPWHYGVALRRTSAVP